MLLFEVDFVSKRVISRLNIDMPAVSPYITKFLEFQSKSTEYRVSDEGIREIVTILDNLIPESKGIFRVQLVEMRMYYSQFQIPPPPESA